MNFIKKENDNEVLNTKTSKEKNVITVELTNDEKVVYSQLGINPLVKLGTEYLIGIPVRLEESKNKEKIIK